MRLFARTLLLLGVLIFLAGCSGSNNPPPAQNGNKGTGAPEKAPLETPPLPTPPP